MRSGKLISFISRVFWWSKKCFPALTSPPCRAISTAGRGEPRSRDGVGETLDGRPRFDIERDHAPDHPSLRRVASPTEISEAYRHTALNSRMATIAAQLIGGSGTRFHHSKINSKLPHTATEVKWHQDFLFTPHSNDDIITALLMVSEVTPENGPLNVVPGSHQGRCGPTGRRGASRGGG